MAELTESLQALTPAVQALLAGIFTWAATALGAAAVFLAREPSRRFLDTALGFAAGVMIAASFCSPPPSSSERAAPCPTGSRQRSGSCSVAPASTRSTRPCPTCTRE